MYDLHMFIYTAVNNLDWNLALLFIHNKSGMTCLHVQQGRHPWRPPQAPPGFLLLQAYQGAGGNAAAAGTATLTAKYQRLCARCLARGGTLA